MEILLMHYDEYFSEQNLYNYCSYFFVCMFWTHTQTPVSAHIVIALIFILNVSERMMQIRLIGIPMLLALRQVCMLASIHLASFETWAPLN